MSQRPLRVRLNPRRSLAARLALVFGLVNLLAVVALGLAVYGLTWAYVWDRASQDLDLLAEFYGAYTATTAPDDSRLAALGPQIAGFFAPQADYDVRLFSRTGALLAATRDIGPLPSSAARNELGLRRTALFVAAAHDDSGRRYAARPVRDAAGSLLAVVEVSRDVRHVQSFFRGLRLVLAGAGGLALAAGLAASLLLARHMARPLRTMQEATVAIAGGDFERRLPAAGDDEIGRLAGSINRMAVDLARLEAARRDFVARVSHDLRTPLTAIKGLVVNLQDDAPPDMQPALATMDEQTDRLIRLVEDLLTLARAQRGELRLRLAEADLSGVARAVVRLAGERAGHLGVDLRADLPSDLPPVHADGDRLQQAVLNLVDNALRATPAGGNVCVRAGVEGGDVVLTVQDEGPGLSEEESARAFEPYVHSVGANSASRQEPGGGTGLGLAIAREIVLAHGGRIWLRARPEGGAEAGLALPASRQQDPR